MNDQTPISTTPNTPLDALKGAYLRSHDRIMSALDDLIGGLGVDEDRTAIGLLDSADQSLALLVCEALGYDKPDRTWVPTPNTAPELYRYDDGTPVVFSVPLGLYASMDIWPRFDTKDDVQALLGYSLDLIFPTAEARAEKAAAEAAADEQRHPEQGDLPTVDHTAAALARGRKNYPGAGAV